MKGRMLLVMAATFGVAACAYKPHMRAAGWTLVDTEHVRLRTTLSPSSAAEVAAEFQAIRDRLAGSALGCAQAGRIERFSVTVLPASEFHDFAPEWMAGLYRRWSVAWLSDYEAQIVLPDDLDRDATQAFQHELTHHLVATCMPRAPTWLQEGLASFLETAIVDDGMLQIGQMPFLIQNTHRPPSAGRYRGIRVTLVSRYALPPIADVVKLSNESFYSSEGHGSASLQGSYAMAWALVHFLELGAKDLAPRFSAFLTALRDEEGEPEALFATHFGGLRLQERFDKYLAEGSFPYVGVRVSLPKRRPPQVRAMSEAEGHLHWAWLWSKSNDPAEGRTRMSQHLDQARRDPSMRARAQVFAAAVRWTSGDPAGAAREVEEGLRAAPDDPALLHADIEIRLGRRADASASGARLRPLARTAEQLCAVAAVDLIAGDPKKGLVGALRGRSMKPNYWLCREVEREARDALRK